MQKLEKKAINKTKNQNQNKQVEDIEFDNIEDIDMTYDTNNKNISQMNEDVAKDRYSRYIGAMGYRKSI